MFFDWRCSNRCYKKNFCEYFYGFVAFCYTRAFLRTRSEYRLKSINQRHKWQTIRWNKYSSNWTKTITNRCCCMSQHMSNWVSRKISVLRFGKNFIEISGIWVCLFLYSRHNNYVSVLCSSFSGRRKTWNFNTGLQFSPELRRFL